MQISDTMAAQRQVEAATKTAQQQQLPQLLKLREWRELTGLSDTTTRLMIRKGKLRAVSHNGGHDFRIPLTEVFRVFKAVPAKG
jgi:excisionase family DNA binding protein